MSNIDGKSVLITGGASGIGKIMGGLVLGLGARQLVIWDINKENLDSVVNELRSINKNVNGYIVDVSDPEQIVSTAAQVKKERGDVDILINNAGIVVGKYFHEHTHKEIEATMKINTNAQMHIALEFLNGMLERNEGHICNVASAAGMLSNPRMSVYCASKWASIGWSDSLRLEMEKLKKNVKVTTILPYYIKTGMFDGVKSLIPLLKPETAAKKIIGGITGNKKILRIPWIVNFLPFFQGILPLALFDWFVGGVLGIYRTMDQFTGRIKK
jgi:short-subunit dehydrogenase